MLQDRARPLLRRPADDRAQHRHRHQPPRHAPARGITPRSRRLRAPVGAGVRAVGEAVELAIVGAGQAGLSLSHQLTAAGVEHVILERGRVGESWRRRWESFRLVFPNWTIQLPGGSYTGPDPDGFLPKADFVDHLAGYSRSFRAPVREEVEVISLQRNQGSFRLETSAGPLQAREVVLATGGYQKPHRPAGLDQLAPHVHLIDVDGYTNPAALPPGAVLVLGSGQTGCQIAEELLEAGRRVDLACGRAPWIPRRIEDRDTIAWLNDTPFFEATLADLPNPRARLLANPQASGQRDGHDLHYRTLQAAGVQLLGRFQGVEDGRVHFASDLAESVAFGDARLQDICELIRKTCIARGHRVPEMVPPPPFAASAPEALEVSTLGSVVCTSGFRPDYASWVRLPAAFDDLGFPIQTDGSSTVVPGLHFMGIHFQRNRKSSNFLGVAEDARVLAEQIAGRRVQASIR